MTHDGLGDRGVVVEAHHTAVERGANDVRSHLVPQHVNNSGHRSATNTREGGVEKYRLKNSQKKV